MRSVLLGIPIVTLMWRFSRSRRAHGASVSVQSLGRPGGPAMRCPRSTRPSRPRHLTASPTRMRSTGPVIIDSHAPFDSFGPAARRGPRPGAFETCSGRWPAPGHRDRCSGCSRGSDSRAASRHGPRARVLSLVSGASRHDRLRTTSGRSFHLASFPRAVDVAPSPPRARPLHRRRLPEVGLQRHRTTGSTGRRPRRRPWPCPFPCWRLAPVHSEART